jgi:hypothetical protein
LALVVGRRLLLLLLGVGSVGDAHLPPFNFARRFLFSLSLSLNFVYLFKFSLLYTST